MDNRICPNCGAISGSDALFCTQCGTKLDAEVSSAEQPVEVVATCNPYNENDDWVKRSGFDPDFVALIGEKKEVYIPKFIAMNNSAAKISWNWCAFLLMPFWAFYRRMYAVAFGYIGAALLLGIIAGFGSPILEGLFTIAFWVSLGLWGNFFYYKTLDYKKDQLKVFDAAGRKAFIEKNKGTSTTALVISLLVILGGIIVPMFILASCAVISLPFLILG
ncbi:MAG: DUF2628 domain-containing protein [Eggerthellaceae bacterium]|nr:DUF2628 domain-containing protein [Eggerthellaceae bacterium]